MNRWTRWTLAWVLLVGTLGATAGCLAVAAAGAAGAGVAYAGGDLETVVDAPPPRVVTATEKAFADMGFAVVSSNSTELDGRAVARTAGDDEITVNAERLGESSSKISIRVGTFGDESVSTRVLEHIKSNL